MLFSGPAVIAQSLTPYKDTVFTEYFRRSSGWTASDGTISVPLPSGKTLWLMGDSHIDDLTPGDTTIPCLFQVRNAILVQNILQPVEFTTVLDNTASGVNRTPIKISGDNSYFWPGHGYAKRDTAITFWQRYSGGDISHVGNYVAKIYTPGTGAISISELVEHELPAEFEFGVSVVVDSARNYIYLYGMKKDWIIFRPLLARFPLDQDVSGPWEFFTGSGWSFDANTSQQLMASTADYVSPSYSVLKLQDKYYMISQDIGFLTCGYGREIYSWESDNPEGPFTNKKVLYTIDDKYRGEYMITYNATAHPEFIKNNELLISYNVNGACTNYCNNAFTDRFNADLYRPKFIRVPLKSIDPELNVPDPVYPIEPIITGISSEGSEHETVDLYPNPATDGQFTIALQPLTVADPLIIEMRTMHGDLVTKKVVHGHTTMVQMEKPGVYLIHIKRGKFSTTKKVITF
jgi:hypothetical protein